MFSSTLLLIGLGLFLLAVVVFYNMPHAKAARRRRAYEYRQQEEERKEKEKKKAEHEAKQMEKFRKQRFVVCIREKDGRKSRFESILIRALLLSGVTVEPMPENNEHIVADGEKTSLKCRLFMLTGTSWHTKRSESDCDSGAFWIGEYTHCDYRLLTADNDGNRKILAAGCDCRYSSEENALANQIIRDLSLNMQES
jgi:hypothetical protein